MVFSLFNLAYYLTSESIAFVLLNIVTTNTQHLSKIEISIEHKH